MSNSSSTTIVKKLKKGKRKKKRKSKPLSEAEQRKKEEARKKRQKFTRQLKKEADKKLKLDPAKTQAKQKYIKEKNARYKLKKNGKLTSGYKNTTVGKAWFSFTTEGQRTDFIQSLKNKQPGRPCGK